MNRQGDTQKYWSGEQKDKNEMTRAKEESRDRVITRQLWEQELRSTGECACVEQVA